MQNDNERPICHRAEDLVTYLYGEASAEEARDFASHMRQCDACRAEFIVFNRVHDSIAAWRNEALGPIVAAAAAPEVSFVHPAIVRRKLPALAALREFFTVSPLWLRGATAFAGLLLCGLLVFAISRLSQKPAQVTAAGSDARYTEEQFQKAVDKQVADRLAQMNQTQKDPETAREHVRDSSNDSQRPQVATSHSRTGTPRNRLTREERVQLAADLGLIQAREEEAPFVLPDEPNQ
jgi:hypothetical protein